MPQGSLAIVKIDDEWECRCRREDQQIPRDCDFQWDSGRKSWFTRDMLKIAKVRTRAAAAGMDVHYAQLPDIKIPSWKGHPSLALDGPEFPAPPSDDGITPLEYFPFQKGGIDFCLKRKHTLLADDMGLGKGIQAVGVMNAEPIETALILCPASIKQQWANVLDQWLNYHRTIGIAEGKRWPKTHIKIVNYDILRSNMENLRAQTWDLVIADECAALKNSKAKRSIAVYGNGKDIGPIPCKRFLGLTGTPVDNKPIDLWGTLHYMLPEIFNSWWAFTLLYCDGKFGRFSYECTGSSNMKILGAILREKVMVRRLKRHVLKQLPTKRREIITLDATPDGKRAVATEMQEYEAATGASSAAYRAGDREGFDASQMKALGQIARARMGTALAKVGPAVEVMKDWIEGEKLVVACYHRKVIAAFEKAFGSAALSLHGETRNRQGVIDRFIDDDSKRVFLVQITAGGAGVDGLQRVCCHGVFFEFDWREGQMVQMEDRLWRIGQENPVIWSYFVLPNSIDQKFLEINGQKAWVSRSILDEPAHEAAGEPAQPKPGQLL